MSENFWLRYIEESRARIAARTSAQASGKVLCEARGCLEPVAPRSNRYQKTPRYCVHHTPTDGRERGRRAPPPARERTQARAAAIKARQRARHAAALARMEGTL